MHRDIRANAVACDDEDCNAVGFYSMVDYGNLIQVVIG